MLDANLNPALLAVRFHLPFRERMIARRADVNTTAKAADLGPRFGLDGAICAVGEHVRRRVGFVQNVIKRRSVTRSIR